jgi:hypothetical protein
MASLAVHIYINGVAVNACELNRTKSYEFRMIVLNTLKPMNKNHYLDIDMDSNDEYGIITCTDEHDKVIPIPPDIIARTNKYIGIPTSSDWTYGNIKILLSFIM